MSVTNIKNFLTSPDLYIEEKDPCVEFFHEVGRCLWDVCIKIYHYLVVAFCFIFCIKTFEDHAIESFYLRDTQFSLMNRVDSVREPASIACTAIATEAALQYLNNNFSTEEQVEKALYVGGMRMLESACIINCNEEFYRQLSELPYDDGKKVLQKVFRDEVKKDSAIIKRKVDGCYRAFLQADDPHLLKAFHGQVITGSAMRDLERYPAKETYRIEMSDYLNRMQGKVDYLTAEEDYYSALDSFRAFHAEPNGAFAEKVAGVLTTERYSYMIGLTLTQEGEVVEAVLFDSHGHSTISYKSGAVLKRWVITEECQDPLRALSAYLVQLQPPRKTYQPFVIAAVALSN